MPSGSPATQFGQPGGPDPVEAGRKGGQARGVSILKQMYRLMDEETATRIAQTFIEKLAVEGDVSLFKEFSARQDGAITQQSSVNVTGRTVVLGEEDETAKPVPPGGEE